jgi:osmotically-inducible protein OsmY
MDSSVLMKEMKTIFSVCLAVLTGAVALRFMSYQTRAIEAPSHAASQTNKAVLPTSSGAKSLKLGKTVNSKQLSSPVVSTMAKSATGARVAEANQELSPAFQVSADPRDQVRFSVSNGVVTVQGSVGSEELARKLIAEYGRMAGVRAVRNQLTVRTSRDAEITAHVRESLSHDPTTHVGGIAVTVCDGIVFLSGEVLTEEESTHAEELASKVSGVARVSNGLRFPPPSRYPVRMTSGTRTLPTRRR